MQAVVVTGPVLKQQRGGPGLTGRAAAGEKIFMRLRVTGTYAQLLVPTVGEHRERRIELSAQCGDALRQRVGEVPILTPPESVTAHHDPGTKKRVVRVPVRDALTLGAGEETFDHGIAMSIEILRKPVPIKCLHPARNARLPGIFRCPALARDSRRRVHHPGVHRPDSSVRSARLRSMPQQ